MAQQYKITKDEARICTLALHSLSSRDFPLYFQYTKEKLTDFARMAVILTERLEAFSLDKRTLTRRYDQADEARNAARRLIKKYKRLGLQPGEKKQSFEDVPYIAPEDRLTEEQIMDLKIKYGLI